MPCVKTADVKPTRAQQPARGERGQQRRLEIAAQHRLAPAARRRASRWRRSAARRRSACSPIARPSSVNVSISSTGTSAAIAPRLGAILGRQPVAVAMDRQAELRVDALGRPPAVAAQIAARAVRDERREVGIERRLALGARGHRAVAQQRVHLGAAERQRRGQRALERDGVGVGADRRRHQHARAALRGARAPTPTARGSAASAGRQSG